MWSERSVRAICRRQFRRLEASRIAIAKLGKMMEMRIGDGFHALRIEEIELTADYLVKKEEEREIARAERERLREERKVEQELAAARERLGKGTSPSRHGYRKAEGEWLVRPGLASKSCRTSTTQLCKTTTGPQISAPDTCT